MANNPFRPGDTFVPITDSEKRADMNAQEYRISHIDGNFIYWRDDVDSLRQRHFAAFLNSFRMTGYAAENIIDGSIVTMINRKPGYGPHKDMKVGRLYRIFGSTTGNIRYTDDVGDGCTIDRDEIKDTFALGLVEEITVSTPMETTVEPSNPSTTALDVDIVIALMKSRGKTITAEQANMILRVIDTFAEF